MEYGKFYRKRIIQGRDATTGRYNLKSLSGGALKGIKDPRFTSAVPTNYLGNTVDLAGREILIGPKATEIKKPKPKKKVKPEKQWFSSYIYKVAAKEGVNDEKISFFYVHEDSEPVFIRSFMHFGERDESGNPILRGGS